MTDPERPLNNGSLMRRVVVAWVVAVWAVAIGIFLHVFHEPSLDDHTMPQRYELSGSGTAEWDTTFLSGVAPYWMPPQSGSSAAPDPLPAHQ
jgi:hypothetical protein